MDDLGQRYYLDVVQVWFKESYAGRIKVNEKWSLLFKEKGVWLFLLRYHGTFEGFFFFLGKSAYLQR